MSQTATEMPTKEWLEQRIQRLESAVASLRDTQVALQEKVLQQNSVGESVQAERQPERAEEPVAAPAAQPVSPPAAQPVPHAVETALQIAALATPVGSRLEGMPWLMIDIGREFLAVFRMFFDLHYRVAWSTRLLTFVLLPAILLSNSWVLFPDIPVVRGIVVNVVDLVLMFVMFKALHREAVRYMATRKPT